MIFTDDEAKTKWCPFARQLDWDENQSGGMPISANRHFDGTPHKATMCIGSSCMAWRSGPDKTVWDDKGNADYLPRGYCGLAGKP